MFTTLSRYMREIKQTEFLTRELHRSELRMNFMIRRLGDQELREIGITQFDRDAEDWPHRVIVEIDQMAIRANKASHRLQGASESWVNRLWPDQSTSR